MEYMMSSIRIDQSKYPDDRTRWESYHEELCDLRHEALIVRILDKSGENMEEFIIVSFCLFLIFLSSLDLSLSFFVGLFLFFTLLTHCLW